MITKTKENTLIAIAYMLAGTLLFSIADATGKWLTATYPVIQISWLRSITGLLTIGLFAFLSGRLGQLKTTKPGWHFFRSILSTGTIFFIFYGLKHVPIAEYVSLTFAAPFILALLSPFVLHEQVSRESWIAIIIGFVGILIIMRPTPEHIQLGHLACLSVALSIAALGLTARFLAETESAISLNFYIYPLNVVLAAYWAIDTWITPTFIDSLLFFLLGLFATLGLGCFVQAVRYAMPSKIMPIDYARLVWMIALGYFIWDEVPTLTTWIGIVVIVISGIYVVSHGKKMAELEMTKETGTGAL